MSTCSFAQSQLRDSPFVQSGGVTLTFLTHAYWWSFMEWPGLWGPLAPLWSIQTLHIHKIPHEIGHLSNFYKALNWHANVHYSYLKNMYCSTSVPQKCFFSWLDGSHSLHRKVMQRPSYPLMIAMHPGGTTIPSQNWAICDLMEFLQYQKRNLSWKFWAAFSLKETVHLICNWILRISKLGSTNEY